MRVCAERPSQNPSAHKPGIVQACWRPGPDIRGGMWQSVAASFLGRCFVAVWIGCVMRLWA